MKKNPRDYKCNLYTKYSICVLCSVLHKIHIESRNNIVNIATG